LIQQGPLCNSKFVSLNQHFTMWRPETTKKTGRYRKAK